MRRPARRRRPVAPHGASSADVAVNGLVQFGLLAAVLHSSLYLQDLLHFSPLSTGLAVLAMVLPITVAAQLGGRWFDRAGVRPPVLTGLTISTLGMLAWTLALPYLSYPLQVPGMVLTGFGLGLTISPTNTDALSRVGAADRSQASGVLQTVRQLGGTLGVAVVGGRGARDRAPGHPGPGPAGCCRRDRCRFRGEHRGVRRRAAASLSGCSPGSGSPPTLPPRPRQSPDRRPGGPVRRATSRAAVRATGRLRARLPCSA